MPTLLRDKHFVLERYAEPAFIRLARTAEQVRTHNQVVSSLQACGVALQATELSALGILIDWRLSPAVHTGAALAQSIVADVEAFAAPFARSAVLLLAAAPVWSSTKLRVFEDEDAAIAHVCE